MSRLRIKAAVAAVGVFVVASVLTAVAILLLPWHLQDLMESTSSVAVTVRYVLTITVPVIVGWFFAMRVFHHLSGLPGSGMPSARRPSRLLSLLLPWLLGAYTLGFVATWAVGVPAVQTELVRRGIATYHQLASDPDQLRSENHPWFRFRASFPLAPGLVATYFECEVVSHAGWGGWYLHVWYPGGLKEIGEWMLWLS